MADFQVHIDLDGSTRSIGLARSNRVRGAETILFEYDVSWLAAPQRFSLEPALALTRGTFAPPVGLATFGSIGDSAPDSWGRHLMQRNERRLADREARAVRTLAESDYLLGVADETRLGALRFRRIGEKIFQAPIRSGVPALGSVGIQDSHGLKFMIQAGDGQIRFDGRPVGEDGAALSGQAGRSWSQRLQ